MKNELKGKFIVLDGPDGCGKSTQTKLLDDWISSFDVEVVNFRDPGTTVIGEKIRGILLNPEHVAMTSESELLLYMAARVQLWTEKIKPALEDNKCVLLDPWLSSTCAYQGFAGGLGIDKVISVAQAVLEKPWPDITIILDVDLKTASPRLDANLDRMEQKPGEYHQKVRQGFLQLARLQKNFYVIDATKDIQTVHQMVLDTIEKAGLKIRCHLKKFTVSKRP